MLDGNAVLITNAEGIVEAIVPEDEAGDDVQPFNGVLSPGFINCHCHLELSHMKGLVPEHSGLVDFVLKVVSQRHFPDAEISDAIARAEDEMIAGGVVAVGDICNNISTLARKQRSQLAYHNFIEVSGWNPAIAATRLERSLEYHHAFAAHFPGHTSLSPHAPYSVSPALWKLLRPYFSRQVVTIHNQEARAENELFSNGSGDFLRLYAQMGIVSDGFEPPGKTSLSSYFGQLENCGKVILVHNSFTTAEDLAHTKVLSEQWAQPVFFCLCPNANLYIEQALPPVDLLLAHKADIVVGTDSLASNHQLSIMEELKTLHRAFPQVPITGLLQWATFNGAKALGMEKEYGSFEKGKRPGVILLEGVSDRIDAAGTVCRII